MFNFFTKTYEHKDIYIVGDISFNYFKLKMRIKNRNITNSNIIVLGNFGFGRFVKSKEKSILNELNIFLIDTDNLLFFINGDKDDIKRYESYVNKYSNIVITKEYDIKKVGNYDILFIGGSIKLDRSSDFNHKRLKFDKSFTKTFNKNIDIVVSHENVDFVTPYELHYVKSFSKYDKWLFRDIRDHRKKLSGIYKDIKFDKIEYWFSSKYDIDKTEKRGTTKFKQLKNGDFFKI